MKNQRIAEIAVTGSLSAGAEITLAPPAHVLAQYPFSGGVVDVRGPEPNSLVAGNWAPPRRQIPRCRHIHQSMDQSFTFVALIPGEYRVSMTRGSWRGATTITIS